MQLTVNLLKRGTFFLFICFLIQEVISIVCILICYSFFLDKNDENVDTASLYQLQEIANSFNKIIVSQLHSVQGDLFLIRQFADIFASKELLFVDSSKFDKSFEDALIIRAEEFETDNVYKAYQNTDAIVPGGFLLLKHLKNKYEAQKPIDEDKHIEDLFNEIGLRYLTYYSKGNQSLQGEDMKFFVYLISILKAITIRDLNFQKLPKEYSIISSNYFMRYPPNVIEFTSGLNYLFYSTEQPKCKREYYPECITDFKSNAHINGQLYSNTVYFSHPKLFQSATVGQACMNLITGQTIDICTQFDFSAITLNMPLLTHTIDFALIDIPDNHQAKDIEVVYLISSKYDEVISPFVNNSIFKNYSLTIGKEEKGKVTLSLFHLLYYHMFQFGNNQLTEEFYDALIEEYETNLQLILPSLKSYILSIKEKDFIDEKPFSFNLSQTYIAYSLNQKGEYYHPNNEYFKDVFHYVITPIVINSSNEKNNSNRFIYFSFVVNRNEVTIRKNDLYHLLSIQAVNFFLYGVFLILFLVFIFYFAFELYTNNLLSPIKKFREDLVVILSNIPTYINSTVKTKDEKLQSNESNGLNLEGDSGIYQYRNVDTKEVEYSIVFLKRILLMKYSNSVKCEEKAMIYKESLSHLQKYPIEFIKCSFIVAINLFKSHKYSEAIDTLNDIANKLRSQIAKISINEDVKLSTNLSYEYKSYINAFSDMSKLTNPSARRSFDLHMLFQNCFYLIGLVDWVWFKQVKALGKQKDNSNSSIRKKDKNHIDYFLIDKGIKAFTNALEINNLIKTNLLKCIWVNLLLSKCEYEKEQYQKSNWYLQEAYVELIDFNNYFINSTIPVNENTIILINGILLQNILYHFGKLLVKMKKNRTALEVFIQCIEISVFKLEKIQSNCFLKIARLLKGKHRNEARIIKKIYRRLNPDSFDPVTKSIIILTSFEFLNGYDLIEELKDALMKYTMKLFDSDNANFGYVEMGVRQTKSIDLCTTATFCDEFQRRHDSNEIFAVDNRHPSSSLSGGSDSNPKGSIDSSFESFSGNLHQGIMKAIDMFNEFNSQIPQDKYIFLFGISKFIDFCEDEQWCSVRNKLLVGNISLYVFCFENEIPEKQLEMITSYLKKFNSFEGILFKVSSFHIIKKAFENITTRGNKKVLIISFNDCNNIF